MAVIKAQSAAGMLKEAIVLDLGDLTRQAARVQAAAEAKAKLIIADAQRQAQQMQATAKSQGFDQGKAEGLAAGRAEGLAQGLAQGKDEAFKQHGSQLVAVTKTWTDACKQWDSQREQLERQAHQAVLELALKVTERLVHRVIEVDPSVVADQLAAALTHVLGIMHISVEICPADRASLQSALPQLAIEFPQFKHIELIDNDSVGPGGCIVSYGQGRIDATIDTQLRRLVELMLPEVKSHQLSAISYQPEEDGKIPPATNPQQPPSNRTNPNSAP